MNLSQMVEALTRPQLAPASPALDQIERLQALGFYIEDMSVEWGRAFQGQYRWIRPGRRADGADYEFQDSGTSDSAHEAWGVALEYSRFKKL